MPKTDGQARDLIPLTPLSFHILLALASEPNHGYGLMKEIRARTDGRLHPATGTVYLALQRLEDDGVITPADRKLRKGDDARRRYYRLTNFGKQVARAEARRLAALLGHALEVDLLPASAVIALAESGGGHG